MDEDDTIMRTVISNQYKYWVNRMMFETYLEYVDWMQESADLHNQQELVL